MRGKLGVILSLNEYWWQPLIHCKKSYIRHSPLSEVGWDQTEQVLWCLHDEGRRSRFETCYIYIYMCVCVCVYVCMYVYTLSLEAADISQFKVHVTRSAC